MVPRGIHLDALSTVMSPLIYNPSAETYTDIIQSLGTFTHNATLATLKYILEKSDKIHRDFPERKEFYYVKQTRERTLITVFGSLTYKRTEYIDRIDKSSFCYIDRQLIIKKRGRFDMCIQAMIIEAYADHNSMIEVGKIVGDRINSFFNKDPARNTAIPPTNSIHYFISLRFHPSPDRP